jgi:hypothetical protein
MPDLLLHGREVHTVFDLLGDNENDITYSLGWALAHSPRLIAGLLGELTEDDPGEIVAVRLQEFVSGGGFTDIEVDAEHFAVIIEAKRGWTLPTATQLQLYAPRLSKHTGGAVVSMSECSSAWAQPRLPVTVGGQVPVQHLSWRHVTELATAAESGAGQVEKRLLREFVRYLKGLMTMQNTTSNMVYVVSLGVDDLFGSGVSFADIVVKHNRYFHPVGGGRGGWPKDPPNYLGFRFWGRLQQIRHVESYEVHESPWDQIPALAGKPDWPIKPHYLYELGPVIEPPQEVRTGKLYRSQRVWCALDLLLVCQTIAEARDETNTRLDAAGAA